MNRIMRLTKDHAIEIANDAILWKKIGGEIID